MEDPKEVAETLTRSILEAKTNGKDIHLPRIIFIRECETRWANALSSFGYTMISATTETVSPPVVRSPNIVHPVAELHPCPDNQMEVDAPLPAGAIADRTPAPPPPPTHGPVPSSEPPPGPPPGEPPAAEDTEEYLTKHRRLWLELPQVENAYVKEKAETLLNYKIGLGFIRAQNRFRCRFEHYTRGLLCLKMPDTWTDKQKEAMYDAFHVNERNCRYILWDIIKGGLCKKPA